jgi:hypothetical protein
MKINKKILRREKFTESTIRAEQTSLPLDSPNGRSSTGSLPEKLLPFSDFRPFHRADASLRR